MVLVVAAYVSLWSKILVGDMAYAEIQLPCPFTEATFQARGIGMRHLLGHIDIANRPRFNEGSSFQVRYNTINTIDPENGRTVIFWCPE